MSLVHGNVTQGHRFVKEKWRRNRLRRLSRFERLLMGHPGIRSWLWEVSRQEAPSVFTDEDQDAFGAAAVPSDLGGFVLVEWQGWYYRVKTRGPAA